MAPASERARVGRAFQTAIGVMAGIITGFMIGELGLPHIFGFGRLTLFVPLIVLGAVIGLAGYHRALVLTALGFTGLFCLIAYTDLIRGAASRLIRSDPLPPSADAVVVLSAGVTLDGMLQQQGLDRLLKGIEIARAGVAPRIVLTRERKRIGNEWITSVEDQNRLIALGGGIEVISTGLVTSTREEALRVAALARERNWKRLIVVTSPLHARRACATFERAGLAVSCVPSDSRDISLRRLSGADNRLKAFGMWIYELAGTLRYMQAGWI